MKICKPEVYYTVSWVIAKKRDEIFITYDN